MVSQEGFKIYQSPSFFYGVRGESNEAVKIRSENITDEVSELYYYFRGILSLFLISTIYILAILNGKVTMAHIEEM